MIADTAFLTSSPWLCDLSVDSFSGSESSPGTEAGKYGCDTFDTWTLDDTELISEGTITDLAALLNYDGDDDDDDVCLQTAASSDLDLLSTSVLNFIEEATDDVDISVFSSFDGQSLQNDAASVAASTSSGYSSGCESCISNEDAVRSMLHRCSHSPPNATVSESTEKKLHGRRKKQRKSETKPAKPQNKKWSSMSEEEQRQVIGNLTQVISSELGMRERLEAIHIINPHARVSPTDTECYIDISPINDSRFSNLQKFVKLHTGSSVKNCAADSTEHNSQRRQEKQPTHSSAFVSDHLVMCAKGRGRKRKGRSSRREQKALCQQLSKEAIQRLKEEQSGYFVHEVRMAVTSLPAEDEDDDDGNIDVLE